MTYEQCKAEFIKKCAGIARSMGAYEVVRDFAEMGRIAILNNCTPFGNEEAEKQYLQLVKRYDRDQLNEMAHLLALTQMAYQDRRGDFLGECLMQLEMGNKDIGQFFTPYDITRLCAEMTVAPTPEIEARGWFSLQEPAAGGGAMVIAADEIAKRHGVDMFAVCVELSHLTADLCYINLASAGVAAQVIQGNTLTMEFGRCMPTPALCSQKWADRLEGHNVAAMGFESLKQFIDAMGAPESTEGDKVTYQGVKYRYCEAAE